MLFDTSLEGMLLGTIIFLVLVFPFIILKAKIKKLSKESRRVFYNKTHKILIVLWIVVYIPLYGFGFVMLISGLTSLANLNLELGVIKLFASIGAFLLIRKVIIPLIKKYESWGVKHI